MSKEYFIIYSFFIRNIPRNHWQAKWETIWIYFSAIFFVFFLNYAYACWNCEHGTMDGYRMECNACLCLVRHLFTWYARLWWIYYYIQGKVRVNDANSLALVSLFNMGLMLKVLRESIYAHKDSSLIPKY